MERYGRRAALGIGAFLIGVYDKKHDRFETIAKVGTGLSDQGFKDIKKLCDAIKVDHRPFNVVCAQDLYPDVWVNPKLVWVVIADEITRSPLHTAGKTEHDLGMHSVFPGQSSNGLIKMPIRQPRLMKLSICLITATLKQQHIKISSFLNIFL